MIEHKYRDNLFKGWQSATFADDVLTHVASDESVTQIAVADMTSVQIVKNLGGAYYSNIYYGNGKKIKIHTGAIETIGNPIQNLDSFSRLMKALLVRPSPGFKITVGSNGLFWFTLIMGLLVIPLVGMVVFAELFDDGAPGYIWIKVSTLVTMMVAFGIPLIKFGRARQVATLDELPFGLELLGLLQTQVKDD